MFCLSEDARIAESGSRSKYGKSASFWKDTAASVPFKVCLLNMLVSVTLRGREINKEADGERERKGEKDKKKNKKLNGEQIASCFWSNKPPFFFFLASRQQAICKTLIRK